MRQTVFYFKLSKKWKIIIIVIAVISGIVSGILLLLHDPSYRWDSYKKQRLIFSTIDLFDNGVSMGMFITVAGTFVFSVGMLIKSGLYDFVKDEPDPLVHTFVGYIDFLGGGAILMGIIITIVSAFE
jgi:hypothetical protein